MTTLHAIVYALAAFRITRLVGWDDLTKTPRGYVSALTDAQYHALARGVEDARDRGVDPWADDQTRKPPVSESRYYVAKMLHCPWCVGFWLSGAVAIAAYVWPHASFWLSVPFAISAVVGLVAKNLDP